MKTVTTIEEIETLRKESEKALRYLTIRDELRTLEISLWMDRIDKGRRQERAILEKCGNSTSLIIRARRIFALR